jgi:hypothetical protein
MMNRGFAKIRNGLREHIKAGRFTLDDLGVYTYLHLECGYTTGIYTGTASGIAYGFGNVNDPTLVDRIQRSLSRLRRGKYINYPKGKGKRGGYQILIDKYEPTHGEQSGKRLNAWKHGDKVEPFYESVDGEQTDYEQCDDSGRTEGGRIPDIQTQIPEISNDSGVGVQPPMKKKKPLGAKPPLKQNPISKLWVCSNCRANDAFCKCPGLPRTQQETAVAQNPTTSTEELTDIRLWDKSKFGISAKRLRNCLIYVLDYYPDDYFRNDPPTIGSMENEKFVALLNKRTPPGWEPEKAKSEQEKKKHRLLNPEVYVADELILD